MSADLLDDEGENQAVRSFLMLYGTPGVTARQMASHMLNCGFDAAPDWVERSPGHLTKAGAQLWLRMLFALEVPPVKFGCHCDLEPEQEPDGCVIDKGRRQDCVYARKVAAKEGCEYWRPVVVVRAAAAIGEAKP